jgi:hypothetical protein
MNYDEEPETTICYIRQHNGKAYLLQFGKYLVQLWSLQKIPEYNDGVPNISDINVLEELLFIHAYKASNYGFTVTFRESWSLKTNTKNCISIISRNDDDSIDRIIAKITTDVDWCPPNSRGPNIQGFCAELFIPFKEIVTKKEEFADSSLNVHLRSSCQALHYLYGLKREEHKVNNFNKHFHCLFLTFSVAC